MDVLKPLKLGGESGIEDLFERKDQQSRVQEDGFDFSQLLSQATGNKTQQAAEEEHWTDKGMDFSQGMFETQPQSEEAAAALAEHASLRNPFLAIDQLSGKSATTAALAEHASLRNPFLAIDQLSGKSATTEHGHAMNSAGEKLSDQVMQLLKGEASALAGKSGPAVDDVVAGKVIKDVLGPHFMEHPELSLQEKELLLNQAKNVLKQKLLVAGMMAKGAEQAMNKGGVGEVARYSEALVDKIFSPESIAKMEGMSISSDEIQMPGRISGESALIAGMSTDDFVNMRRDSPLHMRNIMLNGGAGGLAQQAQNNVLASQFTGEQADTGTGQQDMRFVHDVTADSAISNGTLKSADLFSQQLGNAQQSLSQLGSASSDLSAITDLGEVTDLQRQNIAKQVTRQVTFKAVEGGGDFNIHLNPQHLGRLKINVKANGSAINVAMHAENQEAARILKSELGKLGSTLEANNLTLKSFDITVNDSQNSQMNFQGDRGEQFSQQQQQFEEQRERWDADGSYGQEQKSYSFKQRVQQGPPAGAVRGTNGNGRIDLIA